MMNKITKKGIIYKAISLSGKVYIGKTTRGLKIRKGNHLTDAFNSKSIVFSTHFSRAIRKYGRDNFKWEIIHNNIPEINLNLLEIWNIAIHNSYEQGYNCTTGGDGVTGLVFSKKTRKKMSESQKGKKLSKETRKKISDARKGKKLSKTTRGRLSEAHKGKKVSEASRKKMSESQRGKKLSEATRKKMSDAHKGKKLSEATIKKMSEAHMGEKSLLSKLTWVYVAEIRYKYNFNNQPMNYLAKKYKVDRKTIWYIINNNTWKDKNYKRKEKGASI